MPKSRWGLGERTNAAPTFEGVINLKEPRSDRPKFVPPYDKTHPVPASEIVPHDLHRTIAHRLVMTLGRDHMHPDSLVATADDISGNSKTMEELHDRITEFHNSVEK